LRAELRRKDGRFATGVLHLWHPWNDRAQLSENRNRLEETIGSTRIRASRGLSSLVHEIEEAQAEEVVAHHSMAQQ
jgi:23S rRNA A2030 N6-methylase RlmJ